MLISLNDCLPQAKAKKYAIPAFNTYNLEVSQGIIQAAQIENSPVIIGVSESSIKYGGIKQIYEIIVSLSEDAKVPVVLHLDHATHLDVASRAIEVGFSSVMIDGSKLPFSDNVKLTKTVVKLAHDNQVSVEAELGTIGGQEDNLKSKQIIYTDPNQVIEFIDQTDVDALAIAVGTSHGLPVPKEHVDFKLLENITSKTNVPLVLHGASNLNHQTLSKAAQNGISKVNIDTQLRQAFTSGVREILRHEEIYDPREYLSQGRQNVKEEARKIIRYLGSDNKL